MRHRARNQGDTEGASSRERDTLSILVSADKTGRSEN